ncbi:MAG: beta-ketoacyl-[acyl-carrier-protein] synthase family protein [Candidatus Firestonebacteria bacterium]|nr:beta-ketoacyl-[acyl-carrier-protein] synthase family protein [Candidatus Firestonebacteria bacterium]
MNKRRVVVTGLGVISSVGIGKDEFWESVIKGKSGISEVSSFDTKEFRCHRAGEIKNFIPEEFIKRKLQYLGRTSQLVIGATSLALKDTGLSIKKINNERTGIFIGTTNGERPLEESIDTWVKEGIDNISKVKILQASSNNISANIADYFKFHGPNYMIPTACAAGNYAIGYGFDMVRNGDLDYAITGGAEAFSKLAFIGFHRLYAMSSLLCQPFDKNRKGMMVGEGAGILFLESMDSALKRNANIYAEILGYGLSCDAYHMTATQVYGIEKAILKALKQADIKKEEVDYICAHGTGTPSNDKTECTAIKNIFKEKTKLIPINSIKSMLGHTMGAASAIEALTCCLVVKEDIIPPTINYETPDPQCDIDCVPNKARRKKVNIALNNAFAFGGNNSCLVIKKFNDLHC